VTTEPPSPPFHFAVYEHDGLTIYEVRPRSGTWSPFLAAVPIGERAAVGMRLTHGPAGKARLDGDLVEAGGGTNTAWAFQFAGNAATPAASYYVVCRTPPSVLQFGPRHGQQFFVRPKKPLPLSS
jgi:hypothetical protein